MNIHRREFFRQVGLGTAAGLWLSQAGLLEAKTAGRSLPRATPESQGVSSSAVLEFLNAVNASEHEFHSFLLLRHGQVIAEGYWEPYRAEAPQMLYSLSKSFTATAIGLAVAEQRLTVDDKVLRFFPEDAPAQVSENLAALRVRDLLTMSVGHAEDSTGSLWAAKNWVRQFLSLPVAYPPGTRFLYNSGATYMLSAIVQKLSGQTLLEYLRARLFEPMGIMEAAWEECPAGMSTGGWGLKLKTESLAKFGQLFLDEGRWRGRPLLTPEWVAEASSFKIQQPAADLEAAKRNSDWHQGYCYQMWRCRHNAYRGDGAFGQYTVVMPDQDVVVAITSETPNMQGVLNLVWEHLLPAMKPGRLPTDKSAAKQLQQRLGGMQVRLPEGGTVPPPGFDAKGRSYGSSGPEADGSRLTFRADGKTLTFTRRDSRGEQRVVCGLGRWVDGVTDFPGVPPKLTRGDLGRVHKVAGAAAWPDDRTLVMRWQFYETPHHEQVTCRFDGDQASVEFLDSLSRMGGRKGSRPVWTGVLERA